MSVVDRIVPWWWKFGGPRDFWFRYRGVIDQVVKELREKGVDLEQIPSEHFGLPAAGAGGAQPAMEARALIPPGDFRGGIRGPHLHYKGQVYAVSSEQWEQVSRRVVAEMKAKLGKAKNLGFEKVMELSDVIDSL